MEIHNIKDISDDILNKFTKIMNRDCQAGKFSLKKIKDLANNTDMLYMFEDETPVYFLLLDLFEKHKTLYIHDVCVNKEHRGKGIFKKSMGFLKRHYSKKGFTKFTLDASFSKKEAGLDQKARIHIFHSAGFNINTETGYFTKSGEYKVIKTNVLLDTGERVELQKMVGDKYLAKNKEGTHLVQIDQIEKCFDAEGKQLSCPMILYFKGKQGTRRKRFL
jgi:hypothetical protein